MTDEVTTYPTLNRPEAFTQDELGWRPWLQAPDAAALTERQLAGLVDRGRAGSDYFRLLARDPDILGARTRTDKDIFYNTKEGLPRGERELAAAATSRANGCVFCASVHARFASHHSDRHDDVQQLLDDGTSADLGSRWNAVVAAAAALAQTPPRLNEAHVRALQDEGLDVLDLADVIHGSAFFNWANRLMLSLGEPEQPTQPKPQA
ncbi:MULTISPECIES: alkylhydroperoxidase domain protein [unclassified Arthrobacter]|uniref:alkylhydroperoxidase domain protein n=1 Tax=unclassified Arthrobacter TaxID=235627 RepID=UPI001F003FBD|nr:alkylhydroperoxidase domain protein [Arthrobacter sp. FW305-BF8]UKA53883.1 alkylhydroperoxidase domain protein [Arthrobacter sp. FW305-BF8]